MPITDQFSSLVKVETAGPFRKKSKARALATDVVAAIPNPHTVETTRTPTRNTTPNALPGATCLSSSTTTDSIAMNDAATTRPSHAGGRVERSNSDSGRARTGDGGTSASG